MSFLQLFRPNKTKPQQQEVNRLQSQIVEMQMLITNTIGMVEQGADSYVGSKYRCYATMVNELARKYDGESEWGNSITQNIIDLRATLEIGSGVEIASATGSKQEEVKAATEFLKEFMLLNGLRDEIPIEWAKEAELEGKTLVRIYPMKLKDKENFSVKHIPWHCNNYVVKSKPDDYQDYTEVTYVNNGTQHKVSAEDFVYAKFSGRLSEINNTPPKVGKVLTAIENLDKAMHDWRKVNYLFASPTPHFKATDAESAKRVMDTLKKINWKIGKILSTNTEYNLVGMDIEGMESIWNEITYLAKIISGATNIPVHFLGFPDLMTNRSTAESLMDLVTAAGSKERQIWVSFYTHLFEKILEKANKIYGKDFNPYCVKATIGDISANKLKELIDVWLQLRMAKEISGKTFRTMIPGIDAEQEEQLLAAETEADAEKMKAMETDLNEKEVGFRRKQAAAYDQRGSEDRTRYE